jgi:hypothetical protein
MPWWLFLPKATTRVVVGTRGAKGAKGTRGARGGTRGGTRDVYVYVHRSTIMETRDTNKNKNNTNNDNTRTQCVTRNQTIILTKTCTTTTTTIFPTRTTTGMAEEKEVAAPREEAGTVNHPKHRVVPPLVSIGWVLPRLKILTTILFSWTTTTKWTRVGGEGMAAAAVVVVVVVVGEQGVGKVGGLKMMMKKKQNRWATPVGGGTKEGWKVLQKRND